jgi:hypothetical protein
MGCFMDNLPIRTVEASPETAAADIDVHVVGPAGIFARQVGTPATKAPVMQSVTGIDPCPVTYEAARRTLAAAKNVADVKNILAVAATMGAFARRLDDRSLEWDAIEFRFRAECRLDDMIADQNDELGWLSVA